MIGLALGGGGTKGTYQVGSYFAFKKAKIKFNGIVGTSIGSFNAAMFAIKKERELYDFWMYEDLDTLLHFNKEKTIKKRIEFLKSVIKEKGIKTDLLKEKLNELIKEDKLRNSKIDFGLATLNLSNLKPTYLFKDDIKENNLINSIVASSYLPIFKMERIDEKFYLDGGFFDNLPYNMLFEKGYKKVYAIDLSGISLKKEKKGDGELIIIKPSRGLGSMLNTNKEKLSHNFLMGYYDTLKVLGKFDGIKYVFYNRSERRYKRLYKNFNEDDFKLLYKKYKTKNLKLATLKMVESFLVKSDKDYFKKRQITKELKILKSTNKDKLLNKINI